MQRFTTTAAASLRRFVLAASVLVAFITPLDFVAQSRSGFPESLSLTPPTTATPTLDDAQQSLDRQQPRFIENKGQWNQQVKFLLQANGLDLWITDHGVRYDLYRLDDISEQKNDAHPLSASSRYDEPVPAKRTGHVVDVSFEDAAFAPRAHGTGRQPTFYNYFIGNDSTKWATDVHLYGGVHVEDLYDGVDAVFYLDDGTPRYDLIVAPGADPRQVQMKIEGSEHVRVGSDGSLLIATTMGELEQRGLYAYQMAGNVRQQVSCRFVVGNDQRVSFAVGDYDRTKPLVIDPLVYSTFLGGSNGDQSCGLAVDGSGIIYITGFTESSPFPTATGAYDTGHNGSNDVFVTKLDPSAIGSAQLVYSTYIGGSDADYGKDLVIDGSGNIYVVGTSGYPAPIQAGDFPTTSGAFDGSHNGESDVIVFKLDPSSSGTAQLAFSTYLGGNVEEQGHGIAVDGSGYIYITGAASSASPSFPTTSDALATSHRGYWDAFVTKLDPSATGSAQLVYSTLLGDVGNSDDRGFSIAVDASENIYVTGYTNGENFPTTSGAYDTELLWFHDYDVFVAILDPSATGADQLVYSTLIGGVSREFGFDIAVNASGNIYVTGLTSGDHPNFPVTSDAYDGTHNGDRDAFAVILDPSASGSDQLVYSTFLGGSGNDEGHDIAIDASGNIYLTGYTDDGTVDFPTTIDAYDAHHNGGYGDVFVVKLNPSASGSAQLVYSTFLGGNAPDDGGVPRDYGARIAVDANDCIYVTGWTSNGTINFPTTSNAYDTDHNGGTNDLDVFVVKFDLSSSDNPLPVGYNRPTDCVVAYWPGEDNADDVFGSHDGTMENGATFANGFIGRAFSFDGANDIMRVPHHAALSIDDDESFSVEMLVYRTGDDNLRHIFGKRDDCASSDLNYQMISPGSATEPDAIAWMYTSSGNGNVPRDVWNHVVVTYNGTTNEWEIYINGILKGSNTGLPGAENTADLIFGNSGPCTSLYQGLLDEIVFYDCALTDQQVLTIFYTLTNDSRLPVELSGFNLSSSDNSVRLDWRTASEVENAGFEVQRAAGEDLTFAPIASYLTHPQLAGLGTSSSGQNYAFVDEVNAPGLYHYRLVDVSTDGIRTTHPARSIRIDEDAGTAITFLRLHAPSPNPVADDLHVGFTLPEAMTVSLEIYTSDGRLVATPLQRESHNGGTHSRSLDVSGLAPGVYTLRLTAGNATRVQQFVVVR